MAATMMMKAMKLSVDGTAELVEITKPTIDDKNPDQVLIEIQFSALDTATHQVLSSWLYSKVLHGNTSPLILGWHYAGVVVEVGSAVTGLKVGDEVFGNLPYAPDNHQGSFSEYVVVPESQCAKKPAGISFEKAAASTTETLTALQALRDVGKLQRGQNVLVLGAAGGVGSAAAAIAKKLGATVTAVVSTKDVEFATSVLKADKVIDRKAADPLAKTKDDDGLYDVIFDTPAKYNPHACFAMLKKGGSYVTTIPSLTVIWGMMTSFFYGKSVGMVSELPKQEDFDLVAGWMLDDESPLAIVIEKSYPIKELAAAYEHQNGGLSKSGRITLQVKGGW